MQKKKKTAAKKKTSRPQKKYNQKECIFIVESLINKTARTNYAIQIKTAKKLLDMYPFDFWRYFAGSFSGKKKTSLIGYLTPEGKDVLKNYKRLYDNEKAIIEEKTNFTLSDKPLYLVEDFKPTKFLDFIKKYEKKEQQG